MLKGMSLVRQFTIHMPRKNEGQQLLSPLTVYISTKKACAENNHETKCVLHRCICSAC